MNCPWYCPAWHVGLAGDWYILLEHCQVVPLVPTLVTLILPSLYAALQETQL